VTAVRRILGIAVGPAAVVAAVLLAMPLDSAGQTPVRGPRIGYLSPFSPAAESMRPMVEAFIHDARGGPQS